MYSLYNQYWGIAFSILLFPQIFHFSPAWKYNNIHFFFFPPLPVLFALLPSHPFLCPTPVPRWLILENSNIGRVFLFSCASERGHSCYFTWWFAIWRPWVSAGFFCCTFFLGKFSIVPSLPPGVRGVSCSVCEPGQYIMIFFFPIRVNTLLWRWGSSP